MSHSLDQRMLGYLMSDKSLTLKVLDLVPIEYLDPKYRVFYQIVGRCVKKYNETPTIRMVSDDDEWQQDFEDIYQESVERKDAEDYDPVDFALDLEKIKDRYNTQVLLKVGKEVFKRNWDGKEFVDLAEANKQLRKAMGTVDDIRVVRTYKSGSLSATATDAMEEYYRRKDDPEAAKGIHVGLREFDRITNGLQPSELILIGGESSAGKSALAMNMALNAWRGDNQYPEDAGWVEEQDYKTNGVNVVYFSVEMPFNPLRRRIDACLGGVPLYGVRDGTLTEEEEMRYRSALRFQELYPKAFHIEDIPRGCTVAQVESKYIDLLYEFQPELVVIDYISLMKIDNDQGQDWLNLGKLTEMLHEFCRTYTIPTITPVQLTRPKDGSRELPDQHRVGRSIMIPQNCNVMLNIDVRSDENARPDMIVNIAKMRDGEKGAFTLHKRLDMMRIYDDLPGWSPQAYEGGDGYEQES